jgi:hypothetical protein
MNEKDQNDKRSGSNELLQSGVKESAGSTLKQLKKTPLLTYPCTVIFLNIVKDLKEPSANQCVYLNFSAQFMQNVLWK